VEAASVEEAASFVCAVAAGLEVGFVDIRQPVEGLFEVLMAGTKADIGRLTLLAA
jgi:hypothetical protein